MKLALIALAAAVSVARALPVQADAPAVEDSGSYRIYRHDHAIGTESFTFDNRTDSLVITSHVLEIIPGASGRDTLEKTMGLVVKAVDYDLLSYESHQSFRGQRIHRGLVMADTLLTTYLQVNEHGLGDRVVRPPGRMFVIDPQLFVLYDIICRNLHGKSFAQRPLLFYTLGSPDTTVEATATDLGADSIRWAARPVRARKIRISDAEVEFFVWLSPQGRMLRLSQPEYGLRVERVPAPTKRAMKRR